MSFPWEGKRCQHELSVTAWGDLSQVTNKRGRVGHNLRLPLHGRGFASARWLHPKKTPERPIRREHLPSSKGWEDAGTANVAPAEEAPSDPDPAKTHTANRFRLPVWFTRCARFRNTSSQADEAALPAHKPPAPANQPEIV